eukprot:COSAG02_NODE_3926_length_6036_cov_4.060805_3_plen_273_part_00
MLERLRLAGVGDVHEAVAFLLHCFMEEALAGAVGACERERAGVVETVSYACGVQLQTVPMGGSLAVHVLKPSSAPLHWVLRIVDFAPAWGGADNAAESLAAGLAGLRQAFHEHIGASLADTATTTATSIPPQAAAPKVAAAEVEARARSSLSEPLEPDGAPSSLLEAPEPFFPARSGGIHVPGAGLLGELEPPPGGAGGMLIGPDHPDFGVEIEQGAGGMPPHGPDGAPMPGARWDPIHGQGGLGDPDQDGHADLHRPPSGIDDADVDSMFM